MSLVENQDGCYRHVFVAKQQTPCGHEEEEEGKKQSEGQGSSMDEGRNTQVVVRAEYIEEGNEGFRTPTSVDYRIPVMKHCPAAPRKARAHPSRKRLRRRLQLVLFPEADPFFICPQTAGQVHHKLKRSRT